MKIAVVGPFTWFAPHFPEQWQDDANVLCLNIDEFDYKFLITLINFRPDITLFYRPEIYPRKFIEQVSGLKIAFLSEPIPSCQDGMLLTSTFSECAAPRDFAVLIGMIAIPIC